MHFPAKLAVSVLILQLVASLQGQAGKAPSKAHVATSLSYRDSSGQLVSLESQTVHLKHNYRALGFAGGTTVYLADGAKSPVRLKAAPDLEFVTQPGTNADPTEAVRFLHFGTANGARVAPIANFNALGLPSTFSLSTASVDFKASRNVDSSFKIAPTTPLMPGEYCLIVNGVNPWPSKSPGFCFGVDAPKN